jgi:hypothetical protein
VFVIGPTEMATLTTPADAAGPSNPLAREFSAAYSLSETPLDFGDRVVARLGKVDVTKEFWGWRTRGFPGIPRRKDREYLGVCR